MSTSTDHFLIQKLKEILLQLEAKNAKVTEIPKIRYPSSTGQNKTISEGNQIFSNYTSTSKIQSDNNNNLLHSTHAIHPNSSLEVNTSDDDLVVSGVEELSFKGPTGLDLNVNSNGVDYYVNTSGVSSGSSEMFMNVNGTSVTNTSFVYGIERDETTSTSSTSHHSTSTSGSFSSTEAVFGVELDMDVGMDVTSRDRLNWNEITQSDKSSSFQSSSSSSSTSSFNKNDDTLLKNLQEFIQVLKMSVNSPSSSAGKPGSNDYLFSGGMSGTLEQVHRIRGGTSSINFPGGSSFSSATGGGGGGGGSSTSSFSGGGIFDLSLNLTLEDITDLNNLMDDTNSSMPLKHVLIIMAYVLIAITSIIGNLLVVQLVIRSRRLHTLTHALLANLAISDLFMATLNIPFSAARIILAEWPFGVWLCAIVPFVQVTSVYVTSITMACIAGDRFQVIMKPLAKRMKNSQGVFLVVIIWTVSALLSLPYALHHKIVTVLTVRVVNRCQAEFSSMESRRWLTLATVIGQYFAPLTFTTVSYVSIMIRLRSRSDGLGSTTPRQVAAQSRAKRKTIKMLVLTVIFFALCWFPINAYHILTNFQIVSHNSTAILICHLIAMSSTIYNPFIYCWLNDHFRTEALKWFRCFRARRLSPHVIHPHAGLEQQQTPIHNPTSSNSHNNNSNHHQRRGEGISLLPMQSVESNRPLRQHHIVSHSHSLSHSCHSHSHSINYSREDHARVMNDIDLDTGTDVTQGGHHLSNSPDCSAV